jgi:CRISPR type III-B/RAMP module RAMP protein Cmr4
MIVATTTLYLYVETPLHAGVGSGLSSVDLPIQRERTTQYPTIQGSGIKGKLRALATDASESGQWSDDDVQIIFGPKDNGADHAGALIAGDARILLFPVRSLNGVFAYTTSIDVLARFQRDLQRGGESLPWVASLLATGGIHEALVAPGNVIAADNTVVLEEFSFDVQEHEQVTKIAIWLAEHALPQTEEYKYWREKVKNSLIILPVNDFRDFVVNATEIITRVRIDPKTKTVQSGALWTEEHLPTDTVLYVPIYATNARKPSEAHQPVQTGQAILNKARTLDQCQQGYLQLGGDETVGRGMVRMHWAANAEAAEETENIGERG